MKSPDNGKSFIVRQGVEITFQQAVTIDRLCAICGQKQPYVYILSASDYGEVWVYIDRDDVSVAQYLIASTGEVTYTKGD